MAAHGLILLLLPLLVAEGRLQMALEEADQRTFAFSDESPRGRSLLLPRTTRNSRSMRNPHRWYQGVRLGLVYGNSCFPTVYTLILRMLIERMQPFNSPVCVSLRPGYSPKDAMKAGYIDLLMEEVYITNTEQSFMYPHSKDDLCIVVKSIEPKIQSIFHAFSASTWAATSACLALVAASLRMAGRRGVPLETLRTFISGGFAEDSKRPVANCILLLLSVFGVIMMTAFCGRFTSYLTVIRETAQPETLEDVNSRVTTVYAVGSLKVALSFDGETVVESLIGKMHPNWTWEVMAEDVARSAEAAFITSTKHYAELRRHPAWVDEATGRSLTHLVSQCVLSPAYTTFLARKDWPEAARLDVMMQWVIQAGINQKAERNMMALRRRRGEAVMEVAPSGDPQPLGLSSMTEPLFLLGAGLAMAAAALMLECMSHRCRHRRRGQRSRPVLVRVVDLTGVEVASLA